ncbi:MAG: alpha/beta hydrolase [Cyclobacteriaceae bacterium]
MHGFCETHEIWNGFAEKLTEKFEVFTIDLPGFGGSPLSLQSFKIKDIAKIILDWMTEKKILQPVIVGHSLGGYVALEMAKRNPEILKSIVLFQSTAFPDSDERKANRNKVIEFVKTHGTDPFIDTFVPGLFLDKKHPAIPSVDFIARKTSKETVLAYTSAMRDRESSIDFLKNLKKPILILGGENDTAVPPDAIREMGKIAKHATVHLFKDTGHMAMFECPTQACEAIIGFADNMLPNNEP